MSSYKTPHPRNADPSLDFNQSAISLYTKGFFPNWWRFIPVHGKATYVPHWATKPLSHEELLKTFKSKVSYRGLGVVTGEMSGGLLAIDIDGPKADARFREAIGEEAYEALGEETTMSWTSGTPGRRQILYRVPAEIVPELRRVSTIILREETGQWHSGTGDELRVKENKRAEERGEKPEAYEEVVIRFNHCQSVVPGSPHPKTYKLYHFLNYNNKEVAIIPDWLNHLLREYRQPVTWLTEEDQKALDGEFGDTSLPPPQIRGWFFKEEVQRALQPRLEDLVFKHAVFDEYGWITREGRNPQRMSGCPWHESRSGTAFQYNIYTGCWDCKACGIGGDVLDFIHKIRSGNKFATRPMGADLESYVAEIATALGYDYPSCANKKEVTNTAVPRLILTTEEFFKQLIEIHETEKNPAVVLDRMATLAQDSGRRMSGIQCLAAMDEYVYYRNSDSDKPWWEVERSAYVVPNLLKRPTQIILHAAGGLGKTSACMGLARMIGRGISMKIRGIEVPVEQGPVLWIQNDQNAVKLVDDCLDNGIDPENDKWFIVKRNFQLNHLHKLKAWIREYKPALVVIDSLGSCSTKMQVEEKDKAFAHPLYWCAENNGIEEGFPACSIIFIHHDNAQGQVRGTRYLINAVDEQWHLRALKDDEREHIRSRGIVPSSCRMIEIKKSRMGRQGDCLVVERDQDFAFSVWDITPTEQREEGGQGDPDPMTTALRLVRDRVKEWEKADEEAEQGQEGYVLGGEAGVPWLSIEETWETLVEEVTGQGRKAPSKRTVRRWLDRWEREGLLLGFDIPLQKKGNRPRGYSVASLGKKRLQKLVDAYYLHGTGDYITPPPRVRCVCDVPKSDESPENAVPDRDYLGTHENDVPKSEAPPEGDGIWGQAEAGEKFVPKSEPPENAVPDKGLEEGADHLGTNSPHTHIKAAEPVQQGTGVPATPMAPWLEADSPEDEAES